MRPQLTRSFVTAVGNNYYLRYLFSVSLPLLVVLVIAIYSIVKWNLRDVPDLSSGADGLTASQEEHLRKEFNNLCKRGCRTEAGQADVELSEARAGVPGKGNLAGTINDATTISPANLAGLCRGMLGSFKTKARGFSLLVYSDSPNLSAGRPVRLITPPTPRVFEIQCQY